MRPLIGVTCGGEYSAGHPRYAVNQRYVHALQAQGADAVLLPPGTDPGLAERLHGLLLPGGADLAPRFYGDEPGPQLGEVFEDRDELELAFVERFQELGRPVLGICRGQQVLNVALGGTLIQHIDGHRQAGSREYLAHEIVIEDGTLLCELVGAPAVGVNTLHHQAVGRVAAGLRVSAVSTDGVVEGLESADRLLVSVQCHPEELQAHPWARRLFADFVARAATASRI